MFNKLFLTNHWLDIVDCSCKWLVCIVDYYITRRFITLLVDYYITGRLLHYQSIITLLDVTNVCIMIACNKITKCMQFVSSCFFPQNGNFEPPYSCQNNITKYNHIPKIILHAHSPTFLGAFAYLGGQGMVTPMVVAVNRVTDLPAPPIAMQDPGYIYIYIYIYTPVRRCPLLQNDAPPQACQQMQMHLNVEHLND